MTDDPSLDAGAAVSAPDSVPSSGLYIPAERLRRMALEALERARFAVRAGPVPSDPERFTIAPEMMRELRPGFSREDAERYAAAINNEAAMARAMLLVLAEIERLAGELERVRASGAGRE